MLTTDDVYNAPISKAKVKMLDIMFGLYIRKWLGALCSLCINLVSQSCTSCPMRLLGMPPVLHLVYYIQLYVIILILLACVSLPGLAFKIPPSITPSITPLTNDKGQMTCLDLCHVICDLPSALDPAFAYAPLKNRVSLPSCVFGPMLIPRTQALDPLRKSSRTGSQIRFTRPCLGSPSWSS